MEITYDYSLYRPPSEADSMIFQVTLGCSYNRCSFCNMYRSKDYLERPWEEIKAEIDRAASQYGETRRIFLADGDAIRLPNDRMIQILKYLFVKFSQLERVSCYAMPMNLLQKTNEELTELKSAGLKMLYIGIESGSDIILRKVAKGATFNTIVQACKKAKLQGFVLSCMIILGLGGKTYTRQPIEETARILTETTPDFVGALTLYLEVGIYQEFMNKFGEPFIALEDIELLDELERLVSNFNPHKPVTFRANHASTVYSLGGTIPADKEKLLSTINGLKSHPELLRPKLLRRF